MKINKLLTELSWCQDIVNVLEIRFNNGELSEEDLKDHLKKLHQYLDILEEDIENI